MQMLSFLLVLMFFLPGCSAARAPQPDAGPGADRWEADIQAFEAADRERPPQPGGVLFVGSSSIRLWENLEQDFPSARVLNRGFGGSQLEDVLHYADRIILPYRPRLVLVYGGDNDLAEGKSPEQVLADYRALVQRIHRDLPGTRIAFISIKPSLARWHLAPQARAANALVREFAARDPRLDYIDVFTPMLGADGTPRKDIFVADGLHMNRQGYEIWKEAVAPFLGDTPAGPGARGPR